MEEIDLKDLFNYIKKYIFIIIIVAVALLVEVFIYDKAVKIPMYKTYTTLVLTQSNENTTATITQNDITINQKLVATYSQIVKSKLVLQQVINDLNLDYTYKELYKNITVENVQNTEILKISVRDKDPNNSS